jgi:hypothetical protein
MEHRWNDTDRGKPKYSGKTCPSVTLSTTNPTWTDPGSNPGLRGGRPAANRLSHGTAFHMCLSIRAVPVIRQWARYRDVVPRCDESSRYSDQAADWTHQSSSSGSGKKFLFSTNLSYRLWDPSSFLCNRYRGSLSGVKWTGRQVDHSHPSSA